MGYEGHITRADYSWNSEQHPILESEWMAVVHSDPSLQVADQIYEGPRIETETIKRLYPTQWVAHVDKNGEHPCFWYKYGRITKKSPDYPTLTKMLEIARKLNAKVIGDNEEEYEEVDGKVRVCNVLFEVTHPIARPHLPDR